MQKKIGHLIWWTYINTITPRKREILSKFKRFLVERVRESTKLWASKTDIKIVFVFRSGWFSFASRFSVISSLSYIYDKIHTLFWSTRLEDIFSLLIFHWLKKMELRRGGIWWKLTFFQLSTICIDKQKNNNKQYESKILFRLTQMERNDMAEEQQQQKLPKFWMTFKFKFLNLFYLFMRLIAVLLYSDMY